MAKYLGKTDKGHEIQTDAGKVISVPDAYVQQNPDFIQGITNPPVDVSQPDARYSSIDPTIPAQDFRTSDQKRTQELYNQKVATKYITPTPDGYAPVDQSLNFMFGGKGEHPQDFDTAAYQEAEKSYDNELVSKQKAEQAKQQELQSKSDTFEQQNIVRQRAGLQPQANPYKPVVEEVTPNNTDVSPEQVQAGQAAPVVEQPKTLKQQVQESEAVHQQKITQNTPHLEKMAAEDAANHTKTMNDTADEIFRVLPIDPDRYYKSHNRVATGIGLLLGGIGQGLMKTGSNAVADYINKEIDRDVEAQKNDQTSSINAYKLFLEKTKNTKEAELATKTLLLTAAKNEWERQVAQRRISNESAMLPYEMQAKMAQAGKELSEATQTRIKTNLMNQAGNGGDKYFSGDIANHYARQVPILDGNGTITEQKGFTNDPEGAKKLRETATATGTIVDSINKLLKFADKPSRLWSPSDRSEISKLQSHLNQLQPEFYPHARFTEFEQKDLQQVVGNLNNTDIFGQTKKGLQTIKTLILNKMDQEYKANGLDGIKKAEDKINSLGGKKR